MIRKVVLLCCLFFVFAIEGNCYTEDEISNLEFNKYGQTFVNDSLSNRLNRLETDMLGMSQSGDIDSRIDTLIRMSGNNISVPSYDYYPSEKKSAIRNIWNGITSSFGYDDGQITGFIPPMGLGYSNSSNHNYYRPHYHRPSSYCPYHNTYHRPSRNFHRHSPHTAYNPYGPNYQRPTYGYSDTNVGSSVHILRD